MRTRGLDGGLDGGLQQRQQQRQQQRLLLRQPQRRRHRRRCCRWRGGPIACGNPGWSKCKQSRQEAPGVGAARGTSPSVCVQEAEVRQLEKLATPHTALGRRKLLESKSIDREIHRLLQDSVDEVVFPAIEDERWEVSPLDEGTLPQDGELDCVDWKAEPSTSGGCPVYVMLPLDAVRVAERDGKIVSVLKKETALELALHTFKQSGVAGVMVDVWWSIVERAGPKEYDFSAYKRLFRKITAAGLKIQAVMSFHGAGGNVGDTCKIPLPEWVLDVGIQNPDIFYTDKQGFHNKECLSLGCDNEPLFMGRTPVEMYRDFVEAFSKTFSNLLGSVITELTIGLGPAGELRYPSYPEGDGRWRFPGVGEFQCYDRYMLADLAEAAEAAGHPEWGHGGPHDAGHYNSRSWDTGFFVSHGGRFDSEYGQFFLSWYSGMLIKHADRVLSAVSEVTSRPDAKQELKRKREHSCGCWTYEFEPACQLGVKLAGVHWWFKTRSHAAELTAGYYNTWEHHGYDPIMDVMKEHGARLSFTCVEMRDCEHPPEAQCSPQGLLQQVVESSRHKGVHLAGENALQRYDEYALSRILESAFGLNARAKRMEKITFLRMADVMFDNWPVFQSFLYRMRCPP